ncbi:esterase FE4-like [Trichoplusia ni]|uniref:Carboxylic ester hydrolase n=1 Tax=Trichoplusia ni TaxID=7111 RepID=A0A7E5X5E6_TRINI|nr:esterase FE4-like [Trichoplusia ni]
MKSLVLVLLIIKCVAGSAVSREGPLVSTPKGQIRGVRGEDGDYDGYYGIPYALVDEDNPFGPSTPYPDFDGIFDAVTDGVHCVQAYNSPVSGVIQCLQLNVYVPNTPTSNEPKAVMVYIHGGGFLVGHKAELSPRFLLERDVVVVTINYRLGLHGFLCSSEPGFKNAGLKDQVLAIKWVKDNIAAFGGDADKVTVFGESAGAISIDYHLHAAENFAQRAILMSGSALISWILAEENDEIPITVAKNLGFSGNDIKGAIEFLSTQDPTKVAEEADRLHYLADEENYPVTMPCVERDSDSGILTDYPVNLQPKVKGIDIMIGYTNKEMMFMYPNADNLQFYRTYSFNRALLHDFDEAHDVDIVRQFYIGDEQPSESLQDVIIDYSSDASFVHSAERSVDKYLDAEASSVYKFIFTYEGNRNFGKIAMGLTAAGASHGDDLGYVFDAPLLAGPITDADRRVVDAMTKTWTDFAKYGNPTPQPTDLIPEWKPVDKNQRPYMNIGSPIRAESRVFNERMAFWDLYYKLHGDKVKGYETSEDSEQAGNGGTSVVSFTLLSIITLFVTLFR